MYGHFLLAVAQARQPHGLNLFVHIERDLGAGAQERFVVEQAAHIGVNAHLRLPTFGNVFVEIGWNPNNAVSVVVLNLQLSRLNITAVVDNLNIGRGIDIADKLAAQGRMTVVNNHRWHFSNHLSTIQIHIKKRVEERHYQEENQHAIVDDKLAGFGVPNIYDILYETHSQWFMEDIRNSASSV